MSVFLLFVVGVLALILALTGSLTIAIASGVLVLAIGLAALAVWQRRPSGGASEEPSSPSRRRFLGWIGIAGLAVVAGGATVGRVVRRITKPDPMPTVEAMATELGTEYAELIRRGYHEQTSGDLQLLLSPGNTSNYAQESVSLVQHDPRSSHASVWMYLERVPLLVYAPGLIDRPAVHRDRVTLADLAPTTAAFLGFDGYRAPQGHLLPGIPSSFSEPPRVVVTFVIDGGGWNVLEQWKDAWPNQKALMDKSVLYTNAIHGSFPAVTASAHATIGTGAFPEKHGISGHNLRIGREHVRKAYGLLGQADPSDIKLPTLSDLWSEHTGHRAFIGEFGYQIWHLGMIGRGGTNPLGQKPVAVYWDEPNFRWASQNPDLYRLPKVVPSDATWKAGFADYQRAHAQDFPPEQYDLTKKQAPACAPATVAYQGDLIQAAFDSEDIGNHEATDLVYINYKFPDYTGHIYNMLEPQEETQLRAVDVELGRMVSMLESRFGPGGFALIVTADHGQCPTADEVNGVRLDPIQLKADIEAQFGGRSVFPIVHEVAPSEVFLDWRGLADSGYDAADVAAWLRDYTYGENYHLYPGVPRDAIEWNKMNARMFSGVLPGPYINSLQQRSALPAFGATSFPMADPTGIPQIH